MSPPLQSSPSSPPKCWQAVASRSADAQDWGRRVQEAQQGVAGRGLGCSKAQAQVQQARGRSRA
ncbi:hypothetical protein SLEP1_g35637 [Rubroshorea leprosula]|uniref:Uncharacterized protein n=1 Tax=Rubroshorea leprosula TaxID=152421 RepID=A0AAV5KPA5_9ROSI|nr:hypothetical protein SLEP1_g35637 [Rubroshorea leprosula]